MIVIWNIILFPNFLKVINYFILLIIINCAIVKGYHMHSSMIGKHRLMRSVYRTARRSLSQINENKVRKKREISVMFWLQLKNWKHLRRKYLEKNTFDRYSTVTMNDSGRVNKYVFGSSKDSSVIEEELLSTKIDSSESLCVKEKGCLKSEGCNFPRC